MLPKFRRGAFLVFALTFLVTMLAGDRSFGPDLLLQPGSVVEGQGLWQPLSALFTYPEPLLLAVVLTLLVQWVIGSFLEGFWGTGRYLVFVLVCGVVGMGITAAMGLWLPEVAAARIGGATALDLAACLGFAVVFAKQRFNPARTTELTGALIGLAVALMVLALPMLSLLTDPEASIAGAWPQLLPPVFAGVSAVVFVQPWRNRGDSGKVATKKSRDRSHLRVVRSADDMLN